MCRNALQQLLQVHFDGFWPLVFVSYCAARWWWWSKIICINQQSDSRTIKWRLSGKTVNGWHFKNWNHPHNWRLQTWQTIILPGWRLSFRGCHFAIPLFSLRDNAALKRAYSIQNCWRSKKKSHICGMMKGTKFDVTQFYLNLNESLQPCVEAIWPSKEAEWFSNWGAVPLVGPGVMIRWTWDYSKWP